MDLSQVKDISQVRAERRPFPVHVLDGMESAACFFCAGFLGRNDAIYVHDAGIRDVLAVDHNPEKMALMEPLYPGWTFVRGDAYGVRASLDRKFDIVIADPQQDQMDRALVDLPIWQNLANKVLLLGVNNGEEPMALGAAEVMERTTGSWWAVFPQST